MPKEVSALLDRIEKLNAIGIGLSAEKEADRLLEMILSGAKDITGADGGTLYILEDDCLRFALVRTDSLGLAFGGPGGRPADFKPIPLFHPDRSPNLRMVVTRAVHEDRIINVADVYCADDYDFSGTRAFDAQTGYRSVSLLTVPMKDHDGRLIGALQLINALDPRGAAIIPFSPADERLVASLASQAAVTLSRRRLIDDLQILLASLVRLIAAAIDEKSPYTGGHCRRVPVLTLLLADAVSTSQLPLFREVCFDQRQRHELEIASWLHDCGKITTPEHMINKRTKLETVTDRIELIDVRFDLLRQNTQIRFLQAQTEALVNGQEELIPALLAERDRDLAQLDEDQHFIFRCNRGEAPANDKELARLQELATRPLPGSGQGTLLAAEDLRCLSVHRGTLTPEERQIVNGHAGITLRLLSNLPFPEHLRQVPTIAASHHERMDGTGYPQGLAAGQMSLQARILAIADIFEALTAADRPYRRANTLSEALLVMGEMQREGHIDPDLFDLFLRERIFLQYARAFLRPEQIDEVDSAMIVQLTQSGERRSRSGRAAATNPMTPAGGAGTS